MTMGYVTITERNATFTAPPTSPYTIAVIGTLEGQYTAHTQLDNGEIVHWRNAQAAITALTPDSGTPTGTIWQALTDIRAYAPGAQVQLAKVANLLDPNPPTTPTSAVQTAVALWDKTQDIVAVGNVDPSAHPPDWFLAPDAFVSRADNSDSGSAATTAASMNLGTARSMAIRLGAIVIVNPPGVGTDRVTQVSNIAEYAKNNGGRGVLVVAERAGQVARNASAIAAANLSARDQSEGVGYVINGTPIHGIGSFTPATSFRIGGPLFEQSDSRILWPANIAMLRRRNGQTELWARENLFTVSGPSYEVLDYIQAYRTSYEIRRHMLSASEILFTGYLTRANLDEFVRTQQAYLDDLALTAESALALGTIEIDEVQTQGQRAFFDVMTEYRQVPGRVHFDISNGFATIPTVAA